MENLERCRCGNTKPKLNFNLSVDPPKKVRKKSWQVICFTCDVRGPKRDSGPEAVKDWNNLVAPQKEQSLDKEDNQNE